MNSYLKLCKFAILHPDILKLRIVKNWRKFQNLRRFNDNNDVVKPTNITFRITEKCNLRCSMCFLYGETGSWRNKIHWDELSFEDVSSTLNDVSQYRPMVTITGGEPFLHKNLFMMVDHIKRNKMFCQVFTNGLLIEKKLDRILESPIDIITVSIDGPSEVHDSLRNAPGLFNRVAAGILAIQKEKGRRRTKKPLLAMSFTITALNQRVISQMADLANDLGIEILNISHLCMTNEREIIATKRILGIPVSTSWPAVEGYIASPDGINPDVIFEDLKSLYSRFKGLVYQSPHLPDEKIRSYYSREPIRLRKQCFSPWFKVHIQSNGDVTPCTGIVIGNIHREGFESIWNGDKMRDFRSKLRKYGKLPFCDRKCCERHFKLAGGIRADGK